MLPHAALYMAGPTEAGPASGVWPPMSPVIGHHDISCMSQLLFGNLIMAVGYRSFNQQVSLILGLAERLPAY